ncbi:MAG TPA: hypothetical protein VFZ78_02150 [Flavisolibacter sp.]
MKKISLYLLIAAVPLLFSCMKDASLQQEDSPAVANRSMQASAASLKINVTGLGDLGPHFRYEGWIIVNGAAVSTGRFRVNKGGVIAPHQFNVPASQLDAATAFVLTIEPHPDADPGPSGTKILAGDFSGDVAMLSVAHMAALGNDFTSATGKYLLATPTTATMADEKSGVWFIDNASGSPVPGLSLPLLPAGWRYEGWTVISGMPLTTGTFLLTNMADMAAPFSGPLPGPPFPGEDYVANAPAGLTFPTDLSGSTIVITIEPYPDTSPDPFFLKPLAGMVPANAMQHVSYMMTNVASMLPQGEARR